MAYVPLQQSGGGGGGGVTSFTGDSVAYNNSASTGAVTLSLIAQIANKFFAGPTSGGNAAPTWRAMVIADLPTAIPNANLANSSITINGDGVLLSSPGATALGATASFSLSTQLANKVFAGPTSGGALAPTFRTLVALDIPNIAESQVTNLTTDLAAKQATLTGTGLARNTGACTELSGAVTTSGSNATTLVSPASVSEVDCDTLKLNVAKKDIIFTRSAACSLGVVGSPNFTGTVSQTQLATAASPTVTPTLGTASTWGYKIIAKDTAGSAIASAEGTTAAGAATLDGTHFNTITWVAVSGAVSYDIYRSTTATSPTTKGVIGNVLADATLSFVDNNIAGDGTNATTVNTTANESAPGQVVGSVAGTGPFFYGGVGAIPVASTSNLTICPNAVNQVSLFMFYLPFAITLRKVVFNLNTHSTTAGIKVNFGLYDLNNNLILDSGAIDVGSATTAGIISASFTAKTIQAGWYYFAQACQDNIAIFAVTSLPAASTEQTKNLLRTGRATNLASGGVLPTTTGTILAATASCTVTLFES